MSDVLLQVLDVTTREPLATLPTVPFIRDGSWPHLQTIPLDWREAYIIRASGVEGATVYSILIENGRRHRGELPFVTSLPDGMVRIKVTAYGENGMELLRAVSSNVIVFK